MSQDNVIETVEASEPKWNGIVLLADTNMKVKEETIKRYLRWAEDAGDVMK